MAGNTKTVSIYRNKIDEERANIDEESVKCDVCNETKPRKEFYSSITICNSCVEEKNYMSIK